ncbi:uncharacterized protein GIQ15_03740 [Arthroderma uncinatum]|uniref:uncharacterized protein n=1 Tax=Arthroderma uncinatum TaxID=74035 RepID=UPI00144ADE3A|nr:uncharacterized protein GIQ15_03740 [Arthroderma uncinatum]KAF3484416.1 hypothetical protein GIQ15_03740 [Arthroderma uncinatum]
MSANEKTRISGITTNNLTGERHIPASVRADGSQRREIRIRPGYSPPEDVELYKNRAAASWKNRGKAGVPGAEPVANENTASAASVKNAKKREAKNKAKANSEVTASTGQTDSRKSEKDTALDKESWRVTAGTAGSGKDRETATENDVDPEAEQEKKARNLKKKLKQARDLRDKKAKGESLLPEQLEKVIRINELVRQLESLGFDADGEKKADSGEAKC